MKPALARGELRCIGATTTAEYRQHIEKDQAFARRFQKVQVVAPSVEQSISILRGCVAVCRAVLFHGLCVYGAASPATRVWSSA